MACGSQDKPPFDQLVASLSPMLLGQRVGTRAGEGQKFIFDPASKKFRSLLKAALLCELAKFGECLGLSSARVEDVMSAAEGDREKQIDYVLLAWVELCGEGATFEGALRALYAADDTQSLEIMARELNDSGATLQRNVMIPKRPSYADSVVVPSPPTQTHFLTAQGEMKLSETFAGMTVVPTTSSNRLMSESDVGTPVELPLAVSLQAPLEESTTLAKKVVHPVEPASAKAEGDTKSAEAQVHMEESWLGDAVENATTTAHVLSSFPAPQMVTAVKAFDEGHRAHEMVSGERKMERMQSHLEELWENVKRIESGLDEVKSDHRRDSLYSKQKTDELDARMKELEEDNAQLKSTISSLKKELEDTKQKLKEALHEAARLREDNSNLANQMNEERARNREEREGFREVTETLERMAATSEREKAELRESLEEQTSQWRTRQEQYERELSEVKAELATVRKEIQDYREKNTTDSPGGTTSHSQGSETGEWIWKQKLGSGGFGEVFAAERRGCPDLFAAKRITMRDSDLIDKQEQIVSAFFKEMKALQKCRHPRVVRYIDRAFETVKSSVHFYLIMEYMSEGSLSDVIKRDGKLDELRAKRFTGQLLDGLLYLHQRNIIHRDIKCSNILLDGSGDIKLADFGCVKFKKSKVDSGAKMTGTAWWMAPELIPKDDQSPTPSEKSDVWSVGATVVEMLTGKRPFAEYAEKMAVIFGLGYQSLSLEKLIHGPGFSDEVLMFLKLCINWEPSQRATVAELLHTPFVLT